MACTSLVVTQPAAWLADLWGRKAIIMPSCLGVAASVVLMALCGALCCQSGPQCSRSRMLVPSALCATGSRRAVTLLHACCILLAAAAPASPGICSRALLRQVDCQC